MPRPRIRNAAIVATVLAVGASLAFREGAFYRHAAGVESRPSKSRMRPTKEEHEARTLRWEGSPNATRREKIEGFLQKNGRTGANLGAALLLAQGEDHEAYASYAEELRAMKDDPVAMAFAASVLGDEACAQRARELEPQNIIPAVRGACFNGHVDVKLFIQAMSKSTRRDHIKESEETCLNAAVYVLGDVREGWRMSIYRLYAFSSSMAVDPFAGASTIFPQVQGAEKETVDRDLALAMRKYAQLAQDGHDLSVSAQWNEYIAQRFSEEEVQRYLGLDKAKLEADVGQSHWQTMDFADAVNHATPEQVEELEKARHQIGLNAAKKQFYAQWQEQEAQRKKVKELE